MENGNFGGGEWFAHDLVHHRVVTCLISAYYSDISANLPAKLAPFAREGLRRDSPRFETRRKVEQFSDREMASVLRTEPTSALKDDSENVIRKHFVDGRRALTNFLASSG